MSLIQTTIAQWSNAREVVRVRLHDGTTWTGTMSRHDTDSLLLREVPLPDEQGLPLEMLIRLTRVVMVSLEYAE